MEIASWETFFEVLGSLIISGYTPVVLFVIFGWLFVLTIAATLIDSDSLEEFLQIMCYRTFYCGSFFAAVWAINKWL